MNWLNRKGPLHNWSPAAPVIIYSVLTGAAILGSLCCGICTFAWKVLVA